MTTGIRVACVRCSQEVDSSQRHSSGLCGLCLVRDEVAPILAEYGRQWLKDRRYRAKGASCAAIEKQMYRLATRVGDRVHDRVANFDLAVQLINGLLAEARDQAAAKGSRIRIAAPGELVAAR